MQENQKEIIYYKTIEGKCPYKEWFDLLDNNLKDFIERASK